MASDRNAWNADELHVWLEDRLKEELREDLADVLFKCRVPFELKCLCCEERLIVNTGCKKRWCPVCGPKITAARYSRIAPIASRLQWPLAVMLSMKNPREVAGCVAKLSAAFKGFRRTKFWRDNVRGGFVGFEITHTGNGAHIHLHCLVDCEWLAVATPKPKRGHSHEEIARLCKLAQAELSAAWAGYLGQDQAIVWVRRADRKALAETIKYPFKPADFKRLKCKVSEIIDEIDAGRRVATFGNCHGASKQFLGRDEVPPREALCKKCKVNKSIFPMEAVRRWERGITAPPKRAIEVMDMVLMADGTVKNIAGLVKDRDGQWVEFTGDNDIPW